MTSPLEKLSGPGKPLREEPFDEKEYAGLLRSGLARLADAENTRNSPESRFDLIAAGKTIATALNKLSPP